MNFGIIPNTASIFANKLKLWVVLSQVMVMKILIRLSTLLSATSSSWFSQLFLFKAWCKVFVYKVKIFINHSLVIWVFLVYVSSLKQVKLWWFKTLVLLFKELILKRRKKLKRCNKKCSKSRNRLTYWTLIRGLKKNI